MSTSPPRRLHDFPSECLDNLFDLIDIRDALHCQRASKAFYKLFHANLERFKQIADTRVDITFLLTPDTFGIIHLHPLKKLERRRISFHASGGPTHLWTLPDHCFSDEMRWCHVTGQATQFNLSTETPTATCFSQIFKKLNIYFHFIACTLEFRGCDPVSDTFKGFSPAANDFVESMKEIKSLWSLNIDLRSGCPEFDTTLNQSFFMSPFAAQLTTLELFTPEEDAVYSTFNDEALQHLAKLDRLLIVSLKPASQFPFAILPGANIMEEIGTSVTFAGVRRLVDDVRRGERRIEHFLFGFRGRLEDAPSLLPADHICLEPCAHDPNNRRHFEFAEESTFGVFRVDIRRTEQSWCRFDLQIVNDLTKPLRFPGF